MKPIRILVVEDEGIIAMDLFGTINRLGYQLAGRTANGEEALELARRNAPDVILMDIHLAGKMDGIEVAKVIRESLRIPVVFLTAHTDSAILARASAADPYGFVGKPFDDVSIHTAVELAHHRRMRELEQELKAQGLAR